MNRNLLNLNIFFEFESFGYQIFFAPGAGQSTCEPVGGRGQGADGADPGCGHGSGEGQGAGPNIMIYIYMTV